MNVVESPLSGSAEVAPFALDVMSRAARYTEWMSSRLARHCGSGVLEFGAGIGNLSRLLPGERLVLTEPDPAMRTRLQSVAKELAMRGRGVRVEAFDPLVDSGERFHDEPLDTVVSANVLEHIDDDVRALIALRQLLEATAPDTTKRIVTLVPAHSFAYGPLDLAMGHFRRYDPRQLRTVYEAAIPGARITLEGFNVVGLAGWFLSGRVMGRDTIDAAAVKRVESIVPLMRAADAVVRTLVRRPIGQSVIGVASWR